MREAGRHDEQHCRPRRHTQDRFSDDEEQPQPEAHDAIERLSSDMHQILVYADSLTWGIVPNTRRRLAFDERWPGVMEHELLDARKRGRQADASFRAADRSPGQQPTAHRGAVSRGASATRSPEHCRANAATGATPPVGVPRRTRGARCRPSPWPQLTAESYVDADCAHEARAGHHDTNTTKRIHAAALRIEQLTAGRRSTAVRRCEAHGPSRRSSQRDRRPILEVTTRR